VDAGGRSRALQDGEGAGEQVDHGVGGERHPTGGQGDQAGLVQHDHQRRVGEAPAAQLHQLAGLGGDGRTGHREGDVGVGTGVEQGEAERDRTGQLDLDRAGAPGRVRQERQQAGVAGAVDRGADRGRRVEAGGVDAHRAVGRDPHPLDAPGGLGHHALQRRAGGQLGRGGQGGVAGQDEGGGLVGVAVRQAPHGGGHAGPQRQPLVAGTRAVVVVVVRAAR
jgi:hypothetical protein